MKSLKQAPLLIAMVICLSQFAYAQKMTEMDASPADIAYLREDGRKSAAVAKVIYSRPQKKGRTMIGGTDPFGKVWRVGANETTEIKLFKPVTFGDKQVPAGTYSLYAIPDKSEWTIIFNSKLDTWGAYEYDESKDVARVKVPAAATDADVEAFTIMFDGGKGAGNMIMAWEKTLVKVPVKF